MIYIDRRKEILDLIMRNGSVKVIELSQKYDVGEVTIRRDLKYLAQNYGIQLTYGGALAGDIGGYKSIIETDLTKKRTLNLEAKKIIARKAASLIEDGDTIALNAGSTVELIIDYLEDFKSLNVITLSLNVAAKASAKPFIDVYMPGGKLRSVSGAFYGSDAEAFLEKFSVDKAFFGVVAACVKNGITHPVLEEVHINKVLSQISRNNYLVADSSKFDKVSLIKMMDLDAFDIFITDDELQEVYKSYAELNDIKII
ncbi:MAG: DeoR/GlpR transcriptional regulator [Firmicutes bacterium HGW-Firmicutes-7]|nr:MAG: DeoR/GlpR transcriptional regulator [Firmicutes bacterium HGW-Firmicutes-7]